MEIQFIGGAYSGRSTNLDAQTCENYFVVRDQLGGKSGMALMGTPGMRLWSTTGGTGEVRGMTVWKDYLYAVIRNHLYRITAGGVATEVGTIGTTHGPVWIAAGTTHICIVDGAAGYYQIEGAAALTTITDADFPIPSSLAYQDGYFIVTQVDTDAFFISGSEDASTWDALDFASAEDTPDDALVVVSYARDLWILGEVTTEIFRNSGDADFPYTRIAGAVVPVGLGAIGSVAVGQEGLFWLDDKYQVRMGTTYSGQIISTDQVQYHIQGYIRKDDAKGYVYTQEGHSFYVLTFPTAEKYARTWVFDATIGEWHTRSSGLFDGRYYGNCAQWFAGKPLVGHYNNGNIYEYDLGYYYHGTTAIRSVRTAQPVHSDRKTIFHHKLEIEFEAGVGNAVGAGTDPQAMLDWSDDGGHTWSNEHWAGIGAIGEYKNRAIWRRLGKSRDRIYRVAMTDPVKRVIIGAHLEAEVGTA